MRGIRSHRDGRPACAKATAGRPVQAGGPRRGCRPLDKAVESIVAKELVVCPVALRKVITAKCNMVETRVVFYEGDLWLLDRNAELRASRFRRLEGKATVVVFATIASDIGPELLEEKLVKVHNFGRIRCTPEQMDAVEAVLETDEGRLEDPTKEREPEKKNGNVIGNVGTLRL